MNFEPIKNDGASITVLPVKYKKVEPGERFLVLVEPGKCSHWQGPFEIDTKGDKCICKKCGETVGAMFVLEMLMKTESRWMQAHAEYQDEMKRLSERSRTKCECCGKMTRVSHA